MSDNLQLSLALLFKVKIKKFQNNFLTKEYSTFTLIRCVQISNIKKKLITIDFFIILYIKHQQEFKELITSTQETSKNKIKIIFRRF